MDISSLLRSREPVPPSQKLRKPMPPPLHLPRRHGYSVSPSTLSASSLRVCGPLRVPRFGSVWAFTRSVLALPGFLHYISTRTAATPSRVSHWSLSCELGLCISVSQSVSAPWSLGGSRPQAPSAPTCPSCPQRAWWCLALMGEGGSQVSWGCEIPRDALVRRTSGTEPQTEETPLLVPSLDGAVGGPTSGCPRVSLTQSRGLLPACQAPQHAQSLVPGAADLRPFLGRQLG